MPLVSSPLAPQSWLQTICAFTTLLLLSSALPAPLAYRLRPHLFTSLFRFVLHPQLNLCLISFFLWGGGGGGGRSGGGLVMFQWGGYTPGLFPLLAVRSNSKHWFTTTITSTTAVFSYAIGSIKLSANEQFFCWCWNSSKFVTNNSDYIRCLFYNWPCCLHQLKSNENRLNWDRTLFF